MTTAAAEATEPTTPATPSPAPAEDKYETRLRKTFRRITRKATDHEQTKIADARRAFEKRMEELDRIKKLVADAIKAKKAIVLAAYKELGAAYDAWEVEDLVECDVLISARQGGRIIVRRLDTGKPIAERPLSTAEKAAFDASKTQPDLFGDPDAAASDLATKLKLSEYLPDQRPPGPADCLDRVLSESDLPHEVKEAVIALEEAAEDAEETASKKKGKAKEPKEPKPPKEKKSKKGKKGGMDTSSHEQDIDPSHTLPGTAAEPPAPEEEPEPGPAYAERDDDGPRPPTSIPSRTDFGDAEEDDGDGSEEEETTDGEEDASTDGAEGEDPADGETEIGPEDFSGDDAQAESDDGEPPAENDLSDDGEEPEGYDPEASSAPAGDVPADDTAPDAEPGPEATATEPEEDPYPDAVSAEDLESDSDEGEVVVGADPVADAALPEPIPAKVEDWEATEEDVERARAAQPVTPAPVVDSTPEPTADDDLPEFEGAPEPAASPPVVATSTEPAPVVEPTSPAAAPEAAPPPAATPAAAAPKKPGPKPGPKRNTVTVPPATPAPVADAPVLTPPASPVAAPTVASPDETNWWGAGKKLGPDVANQIVQMLTNDMDVVKESGILDAFVKVAGMPKVPATIAKSAVPILTHLAHTGALVRTESNGEVYFHVPHKGDRARAAIAADTPKKK